MDGRFVDRRHAGRELARLLTSHAAGDGNVVVLALPRGGVPVAFEVARALDAPLDVLVVRKLGVPGHPELAMGAIAGGDVRVLNRDLLRRLRIEGAAIDRVVDEERRELARRERAYRGQRPPLDVRGRTVIVVDDGLATGATMHAAVAALERQHAARVVVAVPVASRDSLDSLAATADEVVSVLTPEPLYGVGEWYTDFRQTTDDEVRDFLTRAHWAQASSAGPPPTAAPRSG